MYKVIYSSLETGEVKYYMYHTFSAVVGCIQWLRGKGNFIKVEKIEI